MGGAGARGSVYNFRVSGALEATDSAAVWPRYAGARGRRAVDELARLLALRDGVVGEGATQASGAEAQAGYAERLSGWLPKVWGVLPAASPAAYLIVRLAMDRAGITRFSDGEGSMAPDAMFAALREEGLADDAIDWLLPEALVDVPRNGRAVAEAGRIAPGLSVDPWMLAGVIEGGLGPLEHQQAISALAASPSALGVLAVAWRLWEELRRMLPLVPSPSFGSDGCFAAGVVALGRWPRLVGGGDGVLRQMLGELAASWVAFGKGDMPEPTPSPPEPITRPAAEVSDSELPVHPRWTISRLAGTPIGLAKPFTAWTAAMEQHDLSLAAQSDGLLGMKPWPSVATEFSIAPDAVALLSWSGHEDEVLVPLRASLRRCLDLVRRAAEGEVPDEVQVEAAGALGAVVERARAIALLTLGDVTGALEAVEGLPPAASPERQLARRLAWCGEGESGIAWAETCALAGALVEDLARQTARTLTGLAATGE